MAGRDTRFYPRVRRPIHRLSPKPLTKPWFGRKLISESGVADKAQPRNGLCKGPEPVCQEVNSGFKSSTLHPTLADARPTFSRKGRREAANSQLIPFSPCGRRWREAPDEGALRRKLHPDPPISAMADARPARKGDFGSARRGAPAPARSPAAAFPAFARHVRIARAMLATRGAKRGEAEIIGVGVLDRLAVVDGPGGRQGRRGQQ